MPKPLSKNVVSAVDRALLEEKYEFVPSQPHTETTWQDRMVQRYHEGLYKEFALADLSRPGQLGLRWRTRQEVIDGRGERSCGNKRCFEAKELVTLEVPFAYIEGGIQKKELVKLRLCLACAPQVQSQSHKRSSEVQGEREHPSHCTTSSSSSSSSSTSSSSSSSSSSRERRKRRKRRRRDRKQSSSSVAKA